MIEVNFDQYCPTIGMCYQLNSILQQKGYIKTITVTYDDQSHQVGLDIVSNRTNKENLC